MSRSFAVGGVVVAAVCLICVANVIIGISSAESDAYVNADAGALAVSPFDIAASDNAIVKCDKRTGRTWVLIPTSSRSGYAWLEVKGEVQSLEADYWKAFQKFTDAEKRRN
jgi:hypothetical protein